MNPLVSICIPTYNGEKYIAEAMASALSQTYKNVEIIVSDDASKDNTLKIIESFNEKTNIPIHIFHHQPSGIGANWNHCVKQANGKYIKFLFQDDILLPTCIEKMVKLAVTNTNVGLVYCKREIIFDRPKNEYTGWIEYYENLHQNWGSLSISEGVKKGTEYLKDKNLLDFPKNKIGEPTAVFLNKKVFNKVGYFSLKLEQALDIEYWYRLMPYFNVGFLDEELIKFRLHNQQASQINKNRKIKDKKLLPKIFLKTIFKYLHKEQKKKLIIDIYHNTHYYNYFKRVKNKIKRLYIKNK